MNFTMTRGDTVQFSVVVTLDDVAYDLTDCSLWFTAKYKYTDDDDDAVFQKTLGDGITVTSAPQGLAAIVISPTDTDALSLIKTVLFWDLQLVDDSGNVYTIASGNLIVNPDVTQSIS